MFVTQLEYMCLKVTIVNGNSTKNYILQLHQFTSGGIKINVPFTLFIPQHRSTKHFILKDVELKRKPVMESEMESGNSFIITNYFLYTLSSEENWNKTKNQ